MIGDLMGEPGDLRTPEGLEAARKFLAEFSTAQAPKRSAVTRSVAGVPVRIFADGSADAVYLHIHGGGFAIGEAAMNDISNAEIASACNVAVVSVDYRLAPEHPYPAGQDDCESVANWPSSAQETSSGQRRS